MSVQTAHAIPSQRKQRFKIAEGLFTAPRDGEMERLQTLLEADVTLYIEDGGKAGVFPGDLRRMQQPPDKSSPAGRRNDHEAIRTRRTPADRPAPSSKCGPCLSLAYGTIRVGRTFPMHRRWLTAALLSPAPPLTTATSGSDPITLTTAVSRSDP
jgi:hypothetical protein